MHPGRLCTPAMVGLTGEPGGASPGTHTPSRPGSVVGRGGLPVTHTLPGQPWLCQLGVGLARLTRLEAWERTATWTPRLTRAPPLGSLWLGTWVLAPGLPTHGTQTPPQGYQDLPERAGPHVRRPRAPGAYWASKFLEAPGGDHPMLQAARPRRGVGELTCPLAHMHTCGHASPDSHRPHPQAACGVSCHRGVAGVVDVLREG